METLINNFISGNLTTAKKQAKRFSASNIVSSLEDNFGYQSGEAVLIALYLKGGLGWQDYCDRAAKIK